MVAMLKKQKIIKNKQKSIVKHMAKIRVRHWGFPVATILIAFLTWLVLSISNVATRGVGGIIDQSPNLLDSPFIPAFLATLFLIAASIYFYIDYRQHLKPFEKEGLASAYRLTHHAKVVFIPRLKYNWRQTLVWGSYGLLSIFMISYIVAVHVAPVFAYAPNEFVTTWKTDNVGAWDSASNQIKIPTSGSGYNYNVAWKEIANASNSGTAGPFTGNTTLTFPSAGIYEVRITGDFPGIHFLDPNTHSISDDNKKILSVEQWGTNQWQSMEGAFYGASNLVVNATDAPNLSQVTSMANMFYGAGSFNSNVNSWDVSHVENISGVFANASAFNQPLNSWNTGSVTNMEGVFNGASAFNQDISNWNVSKVTSIRTMFAAATSFNQPLNSWDTSSVSNMYAVFGGASSFNQPLSNWDVHGVTDMVFMFSGATSFNQSLASWNVSSVTDMTAMLFSAPLSVSNYDSTLRGWSKLTLQNNVTLNANSKFCNGSTARQNIIDNFNWSINDGGVAPGCDPWLPNEFVTTWQTNPDGYSGPTKQITIPTTGAGYNYTVDWGDGNVVSGYTGDATHDYADHGVYTVKISGSFPRIDLSSSAESNKILSVEQWGTNHWTSMEYAFYNAINLTVPATDVPDISGVTSTEQMFAFTAFNQNINDWDVSTISNMRMMFSNTPFNQPLNNWNTSSVTDMTALFANTPFNQPLNNWNVSNVNDMNSMFFGTPFNQPLNNWNTSNVTNMFWMFRNNDAFNQSLGDWNVSNVTDMTGMLVSRGISVANYDATLIGWSGQPLKTGVTLDARFSKYCSSATERANIISTYSWTIYDSGQECPPIDFTNSFITTWKTDNDGDSPSNQISLIADGAGAYDYAVDWGDGNVDSDITGNTTHSYLIPGTYTVKITGTFPKIRTSSGDASRILSVEQWGNNHWGSMNAMFANAHNLRINASDTPDLAGVTDMSNMFSGAWVLNDNINSWDVSNVTNLQGMFRYAYKFNQPLSSWDTSSVTEMREMFYSAGDFNQDISSWDISNVTSLAGVFKGASSFNQPLNTWSVGGVTNMAGTFWNASSFNQPLNAWDISGVTDMNSMFYNATAFNQPLSSWDTSSVTNTSLMFASASSFNQDISAWNTGLVTNFMGMFYQASAFNQPIGSWNMQNAQSIGVMFSNATSFNQPLNSWNVSNVQDMAFVFDTATSFNQPLNNWDTSNANTMYRMFVDATSFNQPLGEWDMSNVVYADSMLNNTAISMDNYDATLIGWAAQVLQNDVIFGAAPANYCTAEANRQNIINTFGWNITDGGLDCTDAFADAFITTWKTDNAGGSSNQITIPAHPDEVYNYSVDWGDGTITTGETDATTHTYASSGTYTVKIIGLFPRIDWRATPSHEGDKLLSVDQWGDNQWASMEAAFSHASNVQITATDIPDLSGVTDMSAMFANATSFNSNINNWDVSNVTDMSNMFTGATSFNQPLDQWDTSSVTDMSMMFWQAERFNQPIGDWNVSAVLSMLNMFNEATSFNQPLNGWDTGNVEVMHGMFRDAETFNRPLNNWDTGSVTSMATMFAGATSFNQNIDSWNVGNVTEIDTMFSGATSFNQPLNNWNMSSAISMSAMFAGATSFNQPLDQWDISNATHPYGLANMFLGATSFNQPLNSWDTSSITNMAYMFAGATSFNQPLNSWDVSNVTSTFMMFAATPFNHSLNDWDVGNVVSMGYMFFGASEFNQPLSDWDVSSVGSMIGMFTGASSFDQALGSWDITSITTPEGGSSGLYSMFNAEPLYLDFLGISVFEPSGLSPENYDLTLIGWSSQVLQNEIILDAGTSTYCDSEDQRQSIVDTYSWTINDAGKSCTIVNPKFAQTEQPDKLSSSQARLKGSVYGDGVGEFVSGGFEWGETQSYGNIIDDLDIVDNEFSHQASFACGKQYHYRAFAVDDSSNRIYGENLTFTLTCPAGQNKAPVITVTSPYNDQVFKQNTDITLSVEASDSDGSIEQVRFYLDGKLLGTSYKKPYTLIVQASQLGQFNFVAVAEDDDGVSTATESIEFSVAPSGPQILVPVKNQPTKPEAEPKAVLDISKDWDEPIVFGGSSYEPVPLVAKITRNLPWTLLLAMAAAYAWQAYRQLRQNRLLRQGLNLTNQVRENMESFLHIVTHYLGTSATLIGLAAESLGKNESLTSTKGVFVTVADNFKKYVNNLISVLNVQATDIKEELSSGGKIQRYSTRRWVIIPIAAGSALTLISTFGLSGVGLWQTEMLTLVFNTILAIGSGLLVFIFFRTWQNQRQLKADLVSTIRLSENALEARRSVIQKNQKEISAHLALVDRQASLIDDPTFKKRVQAGLSQLRQVEEGFNRVVQLTAAVAARTTRAYIPINQITERLAGKAKEKHVDLNVKIAPSTTTRLLPEELDHVLTTLVSNAVEFTPEGGHVDVRADNKGTALSVSVKDTGVGIPKEKIPTLMQPFARATSTETYDYSGLGLNLYITRLIAEKYGGSVRIKSDKNKGALIEVKI